MSFLSLPRINAAGRIKHGNHAVELLTEFDFEQAQQFAPKLSNTTQIEKI
jgi:single-stranded-DNA-specific exonuclease